VPEGNGKDSPGACDCRLWFAALILVVGIFALVVLGRDLTWVSHIRGWIVLAAALSLPLIWTARRISATNQLMVVDCWIFFGSGAVIWWVVGGGFDAARVTALMGTSFAAFTCGGIIGFLFTSYDEEQKSVGRIREWLVGGLATLTLVKVFGAGAGDRAEALVTFLSQNPSDKHLHATALVIFGILGFFNVFFVRETIWNLLFAEARRKRRGIEQTPDVTVKQRLTDAIGKLAVTDLEKTKSALKALGAKGTAPAEINDAKDQLQSSVRNARTAEDVESIAKAFDSAGISY